MTKTLIFKGVLWNALFLLSISSFSQELLDIGEKPASDSLQTHALRPKNAVTIGLGSTLTNGDFNKPDYENFVNLELKRFISSKFVISGNIKKFDIEDYDFKTEGFLSGDLNLAWYILPNRKLSPFIYVGPGILTSNNFKDQNYKVQGGFGLDYLITNGIGLTGSIEVNYIYDEQLGSQVLQEAEGLYYNATLGIQFYFGGVSSNLSKSKQKLSQNHPTIINTNWINK